MTPPRDPFAAARDALRQEARQRRAALSVTERQAASIAVRDRLLTHPTLRQARNIAAYAAHGDELDLAPTIAALHALGRSILLPRLMRQRHRMQFATHAADRPLIRNRYGIDEPPADALCIAPRFLQVVLVPLAAFDRNGQRLGSGGGYYDRCFAFRRDRERWRMPRLIGVGYECQAVDAIPPAEWDVPLDLVVTEARVIACGTEAR